MLPAVRMYADIVFSGVFMPILSSNFLRFSAGVCSSFALESDKASAALRVLGVASCTGAAKEARLPSEGDNAFALLGASRSRELPATKPPTEGKRLAVENSAKSSTSSRRARSDFLAGSLAGARPGALAAALPALFFAAAARNASKSSRKRSAPRAERKVTSQESEGMTTRTVESPTRSNRHAAHTSACQLPILRNPRYNPASVSTSAPLDHRTTAGNGIAGK
mmetsp:Transcript_65603/g.183444  ORF Transcript_65603/g.183444 Transcript_65603/m.183444 type:complete len:223 (+) Transcript_65603:595-1263(+)